MNIHYVTITIRSAETNGDVESSVKNLELEGKKKTQAFTTSLRRFIEEYRFDLTGDQQ